MARSHLDYQVENLLGNKEMPVLRQEWTILNFLINLLVLSALSVAAVFAGYFLKIWIAYYREQSYRRSIRRKYGIPDNNNEPFNIAYAKILKDRSDGQQHLGRKGSGATTRPDDSAKPSEGVSTSARDSRALPRQRIVPSATTDTSVYGTESLQYRNSLRSSGLQPSYGSDAFMPTLQQVEAHINSFQDKSLSSEGNGGINIQNPDVDIPGAIDLNDDIGPMDVVHETETPQKVHRGSKRHSENLTESGSGKKAGKRARRQSQRMADDGSPEADHMDVDDLSRGTKRDRADVESNFGEDYPEKKNRKTRRHRHSVLDALDSASVGGVRGQKRNLEAESTLDSAEEEEVKPGRYSAARKRGKHSNVPFVIDPLCAGRHAGEEWQVNGQLFKVGLDGRRLRQALIKTRRSRFNMPKDSSHPDIETDIVVLVEKWLTEDEYKEADDRGDIFSPDQEENNTQAANTRTENGKRLVWSPRASVSGAPRIGATKATKVKIGITTLDTPVRPSLNGAKKKSEDQNDSGKSTPTISRNSPSLQVSRSFSKWEKQDFEAEAMSKLRQKLDTIERASSPPKKVTFQLPSQQDGKESKSGEATPAGTTTNAQRDATPPVASVPSAGTTNATDSAKPKAVPLSFAPSQSSPLSQPPHVATPPPAAPTPIKPTASTGPPSANGFTSSAAPSAAPPAPFGGLSSAFNIKGASSVPLAQATAPSTATPAGDKVQSTPTPNPFAAKAETPAAPPAVPQQPVFSFGTTAPSTQKPSAAPPASSSSPFLFTAAPKTNVETSTKPSEPVAPASTSAAPKFSFGVGAKPAGPSPFAAATSNEAPKSSAPQASSPFQFNATSSQPSGAPAASAGPGPAANAFSSAAPQQPKFSFGASSQPAQSNTPAGADVTKATTNAAPGISFQFGAQASSNPATSAPSPFGAAMNRNASATAPTNSLTAQPAMGAPSQSPFGTQAQTGFGGFPKPASASPSPFGGVSATGNSPFGAPISGPSNVNATTNNNTQSGPNSSANTGTGAFPAVNFSFGGSAAPKPTGATEAPKPLFGNVTNSTPGTSSAPASQAVSTGAASQASKPAFSFNFGAPSTTPSTTATPFGAPASGSTGTAAPSAPAASTPGIFSFGAPAAQTQPGGASASPFAFGAQSGPGMFGNAKPVFGATTEKK